jgi:predicted CXXCH cytochrome family protein
MSRDEIKITDAPRNDRPADKFRCGQLCQGGAMGNCSRGPSPHGVCGSDNKPCTPKRTFRGQRRRTILSLAFIGVFAGGLGIAIDKNEFLKPGDLSHSHAVIFTGQSGVNQCASCHPNAKTAMSQWFDSDNIFHNRFAQTDSCVSCHHVKMPADVARSPHNLSTQRLTEIRTAWTEAASSGNSVDTMWSNDIRQVAATAGSADSLHSFDSIECASCHREHGGASAIMTAMSNAQCQSCHSRTFESFRDGHPDWRKWPHVGAKVIVFDHATHQRLHFPKASAKQYDGLDSDSPNTATSSSDLIESSSTALGRAFDCRTCHPGTPFNDSTAIGLASAGARSSSANDDNEPLRTVSFEIACADCHSAGLREQATERVDLFALPTISNATASELKQWPEAATGFFDGEIGPLTRWMIIDKPGAATALAQLPGGASITQIDPSQETQVRAAAVTAESIRIAMEQFSARGGNVLESRKNHRAAHAMRQVLRSVPPQLIADAQAQWFRSGQAVSSVVPPSHQTSVPISARPFFNSDDDLLDDLVVENDDDILGNGDALNADPLNADPLNADPLSTAPLAADPLSDNPLSASADSPSAKPNDQRFDPSIVLPDGGWYRDDLRMAISYRGSGHADPVLKATIELAASLPSDDPVRSGLLATSAVASCVRCHVGAMHPDESIWHTPIGRSRPKALTKFSHRPHFNLPQLSDCTHCHMTDSDAASIEEIVKLKAMPGYDPAASHGFVSLGKTACISCHTQNAAGDNCTQCHHYHSHK